MTTSDEDLARAAARGDRDAFSALLARRYDGLFGLCFRLTGNRATAEDLTQDICLALPGKLAGFRGDARVTTWLYRIAVNAAHDRRRRAATAARAAQGWGAVEINRRADAAAAHEARDWLAQAMACLSDELRDTLALVTDAGLSQAEAASVLGISPGTVAWRMSEIKRRLAAVREAEESA